MIASFALSLAISISSLIITPSVLPSNLSVLDLLNNYPANAAVQAEIASASPVPAPMPQLVHPASLGVFNSVAISASRLPAASKWRDVQRTDFSGLFGADCKTHGFVACETRFVVKVRAATGKAAGMGERDMLDLVNKTVNGALEYRDDMRVWGVGDYWATPAEMAQKGAGDCEDFAIAKYWALRSLGVRDEQLQIVVLQDTRRQLFHAVLVAHMAGGSYVLDNVSDRLLEDTDYTQYHPILSFAGDKNFIHGFDEGRIDVAALPGDLSAISPGLGM